MGRLVLLMGALLALTTAAICGGSKQQDPTPVSDEAFRAAAQAAAEAANLTLNDFPAGWESEPQDPDDEDDDDDIPEGLSPECVELFETFDEMETAKGGEAAASAASDDFTATDSGEGVSTEVEVFRTLELAMQGEQLFDTTFETCGDEMHAVIRNEINKDAEAEGEEYRIANFRLLEFAERDLGDWARDWGFAATYEFPGIQVDATFTISFIRSGRMAGTFTHFRFGESDATAIDSLRSLFAERLAQPNATLPK